MRREIAPMSNASPAAGSPPAPASSPSTASAAPTAESLSADINSFSRADLDMMLTAPPPSETAPQAPAPAAPAAAPSTPAKADVPPPEKPAHEPPPPAQPKTEDDDQPDEHGVKAIKVRPADYKEQEVLRLMKPRDGSKGLTLPEAYQRVYGAEQPKPADKGTTTETTPPADPAAQVTAQITEKETALAQAEAKLKKAADDMDVAEVARLTRETIRIESEISGLKSKAEQVRADAERQQTASAEQIFRQQEKQNTSKAIELFPALAKADNAERKEFDAFIEAKAQDPEYSGIFSSPRWPLIMAREFAEGKGWSPTAKRTDTPPASPVTTTPPNQPVVAAPAARATAAAVIEPGNPGSGSFTPTADALERDLGKYTAKQLDEMLAEQNRR